MAAYAALVSVMHIIEQIQHHPRPPISLDQKQVESLTEYVAFLLEFFEINSHGASKEADVLSSRVANAAYAAEDVIESHVVDQILVGSTGHGEYISSIDLYQGLQNVIEDMDLIKKEVMGIKEKTGVQDQLSRSMDDGSLRSASTGQNIVVGFDDILNEIMDKLSGQRSECQIIPIVGMGGIGKTTLATNIYVHSLIRHHFDILAWVTVSREYDVQEILLQVLLCQEKQESKETFSGMSEVELGVILHKSLTRRRYFIILDDIWSIEVWDKVNLFFPDDNNGSRIMITTRLSNLAFQLSGSHGIQMKFLDDDKSWNLLCKKVFGEEGCPLELENIGKRIAKICQGLPLSIIVIGGLLAKSKRTREYWVHIAENLNSIVNLDDNERCLNILYLSYNELPVHLKPCFLYMRIFREDSEIRVSELIKLWVAEGFLKPISGKNLEMIAEEYLKDLIDRNLILVRQWGSSGKIKLCNIHDLLRDLCLREAKRFEFLYVALTDNLNIPQCIYTQRRIVAHDITGPKVLQTLPSASVVRSLVCNSIGVFPWLNYRLLRVLKAVDNKDFVLNKSGTTEEALIHLVNSRYLAITAGMYQNFTFPSSSYVLWNLQTIIVEHNWVVTAPSEIWKIPQLRHVKFDMLCLPDPPSGHMDDFVLENLQTFSYIRNFNCSEEVVRRVPNIMKLRISYERFEGSCYSLNNLVRLDKLESLGCFFVSLNKPSRSDLLQNLTFPHSLKKLILHRTSLHWEDMSTKIGSLPLLQVLKLCIDSFEGPHWETIEGQFCSLKFLLIDWCSDLEYWTTDSSHFPRLEQLVLVYLDKLKEIPQNIGDIPTLQSITLEFCSDSAVISAKEVLEEQEELGNDGLRVQVRLMENNEELESFSSSNFHVELGK